MPSEPCGLSRHIQNVHLLLWSPWEPLKQDKAVCVLTGTFLGETAPLVLLVCSQLPWYFNCITLINIKSLEVKKTLLSKVYFHLVCLYINCKSLGWFFESCGNVGGTVPVPSQMRTWPEVCVEEPGTAPSGHSPQGLMDLSLHAQLCSWLKFIAVT